MINSFSLKFEILSLSGLTWLTSEDQALENTESPSAGGLTECCNTEFSGYELHFPKYLDVTISASWATGILRTKIQQNKHHIYKFRVETSQNWSRKNRRMQLFHDRHTFLNLRDWAIS